MVTLLGGRGGDRASQRRADNSRLRIGEHRSDVCVRPDDPQLVGVGREDGGERGGGLGSVASVISHCAVPTDHRTLLAVAGSSTGTVWLCNLDTGKRHRA